MLYQYPQFGFLPSVLLCLLLLTIAVPAQDKDERQMKSIGGEEHDASVYGVRIGMDVETALRAVFVNAGRAAGQEKPDAMRFEGKGNKDIRVVYGDLPKGEVQIVFANGKIVREILIAYRLPPLLDELRLPYSSTIGDSTSTIWSKSATEDSVGAPAINDGTIGIGELSGKKAADIDTFSAKKVGNASRNQADLLDGTRYDDRYTIGFTDNLKQQKIWWREEKADDAFRVRIAFVGKKITESGAKFVASIVQKTVSVMPDDESEFKKYADERMR